jgi:hypothetical protein
LAGPSASLTAVKLYTITAHIRTFSTWKRFRCDPTGLLAGHRHGNVRVCVQWLGWVGSKAPTTATDQRADDFCTNVRAEELGEPT